MPVVRPFRAYRYNTDNVALEDVVAPPYDVIGPDYQDKLYARHQKNVVRLILGREPDRYASAAAFLRAWRNDSTLIRDAKPAIYVLHQEFTGWDGNRVTRKGFVALCRLEEFSAGIILPHERTLAKPREDRLKLFTATNANFSQIFSLYADPEQRIDDIFGPHTNSAPWIRVEFEDVVNSLWRIENADDVKKVVRVMADKQAVIADGHHRYETALAYREIMRSKNPSHTGNELYNYVMMFFSNMDDDGLTIFPTHRVVHSLPHFDHAAFFRTLENKFLIREVHDQKALHTALQSAGRSFGLVMAGDPKIYCITLKPTLTAAEINPDQLPVEVKELDVTLLHSIILRDMLGISVAAQEQKRNLDYVKTAEDAISAVRGGSAQLAFILNPTRLEEVRSVARAGHVMPQKSTFFFPKLISGLLFNFMEE